jgi:glycosyltransferase involved in cell wall biosynthesis
MRRRADDEPAAADLVETHGPAGGPVRRLALVISNLGWGGAQKVLIGMANHWAAQDWKVTLISIDACRFPSYFPIDPAVEVHYLDVAGSSSVPWRAVIANVRRVAALRRALARAQPDVVVSFLSSTNVLTLLAARRLGLPVIVSERGDPRRQSLSRPWRWLRSLLYPRAFRVVAQTEAALATFRPAVRRRGSVLPNPVARPAALRSNDRRTVVGVGHLAPVKGFDLLVEGFARCGPAFSEWRLTIWGLGSQEASLRDLAERHGIADRVCFPGRSRSPQSWIESAGIFVLSSRHEGFPNVLLEAMAHGLPVIAADCPIGGPAAMIDHAVNGLLVPNEDVEALAAALGRMMGDARLRRRLGEAGHASSERYAMPRIMAAWTTLVQEAAKAAASQR